MERIHCSQKYSSFTNTNIKNLKEKKSDEGGVYRKIKVDNAII